jgi:hypothetical protein
LGGNAVFTIARAPSTVGAGLSTLLLGQAAGLGSCTGGDLQVDAGTGSTAGYLRLGPTSEGVMVGQVSKTVIVFGNLVANTGSVTGALTAGSLSAGGAMTVGSLSSVGTLTAAGLSAGASGLTVTGSSSVLGSLALGTGSVYTIGRTARSGVLRGLSTYLLGQAAGNVACVGGDLVLEAGTGGSTNGQVRVGAQADSVAIGSLGHTTTVSGALVANSASVTGAITAAGMTLSGALTATGGMSTAGAVTAATGLSTAGAATVTGTTQLTGSLQLGGDAMFTINRTPRVSLLRGRSTFIMGQPAGFFAWCVVVCLLVCFWRKKTLTWLGL